MIGLKRLARRWNVDEALSGATMFHRFSAHAFLTNAYGAAVVTEITDAWKKTSPVELEAYRTDAECGCGEDGCEACDMDNDECTDNTRIEIPDWENGEGLILSPCWYAAPTGSPEGKELGMDDYARANAEFLAIAHFYWPQVYQYTNKSHEAMQDALEYLYEKRDTIEGSDEALDALIEELETACGG
jgi:hypothetical protein